LASSNSVAGLSPDFDTVSISQPDTSRLSAANILPTRG
jgi:hypothetical protein